MIYLYTGLNGTGKTSNVLWLFCKSKEYEGRPKYATFIKGFDYEANNVKLLDAEGLTKWQELPIGSLIFVDEAQDFFPISRGEPPEWIKGLAKNRHFGYDFLLTTPNASMIHHYVRKLVNRHTHFIMKHGAMVKALKWDAAQDKPDAPSAALTGEPVKFKTPKDVFKLYTSTALDTREVKIPWRTLTTIGIGFLVILVAVIFIWKFSGLISEQEPEAVPEPSLPGQTYSAPQVASSGLSGLQGKKEERGIEWYTPRIKMDPSTAPEYDHLTAPSDFPRVAACIDTASSCNCYTQQATRYNVQQDVCREMVKSGWFDKWKSQRAASESVLSGKSDESSQRVSYSAQPEMP